MHSGAVAIPPLQTNGMLPPGRHRTDVNEVETIFVTGFPTSTTRRRCFDGWGRLRQALMALVPVDRQWVDGSFVTSDIDPNDLDVTTFFDGPSYDRLTDIKKEAVSGLLAGHACQPF